MSQHPTHTLEQLSEILDALPDYVYLVEVETTRLLYANQAYKSLMARGGFSELVGKSLFDLYPPDLTEIFAAQNRQVAATGQTLHILETVIPHIGVVHADTYKMPLYATDGAIYAVLGISRDMTELEQIRQSLARRTDELEQTNQFLIASGGFLQSVLDSQPSSIVVIHTDGSIRVVNARWRESAVQYQLVQTGGSGLGLNYFSLCREIIGGDEVLAAELERGLRALLDGTIPEFIFEFKPLRDYGQQTWLEIRASRFTSTNAAHAVVAHTDITTRKTSELHTADALRQEKELGDVKSRFLSLVAHEFRTPITIIQSSLDMVLYYGDSMTPDRQASQFQKVSGQLKRLTNLIDEISFLYRIQSNVLKVQRSPVAIVPYLEQVIGEVELVYGREGNVTLVTGGLSYEVTLLSDDMLLHQIFFNLISNAVKYSAPETLVTVLVGRDEQSLAVTVADRGIGILPEDIKRLFEPFYRGGNVEQRIGTGLGLSIVDHSVRALGGSVTVNSHLDEGTTFTVSLPL